MLWLRYQQASRNLKEGLWSENIERILAEKPWSTRPPLTLTEDMATRMFSGADKEIVIGPQRSPIAAVADVYNRTSKRR
jgi:hypothetical protein